MIKREKTKIYMFNVTRNKVGEYGKKELFVGICNNCQKIFELKSGEKIVGFEMEKTRRGDEIEIPDEFMIFFIKNAVTERGRND